MHFVGVAIPYDHVSRRREAYGITDDFLWHHVGYFEHDQELAMLNEFAEGVIQPLRAAHG